MKPRLIITLGCLVQLFSCTKPVPEPLYPIPTVVLYQGREQAVDLAVYKISPGTRLMIPEHPGLDLRFDSATDSLFVKAHAQTPSLVVVPLYADGHEGFLAVRVKPAVRHTFRYRSSPSPRQVVVMGSFNDWSRTALPMSDSDGDGWLEHSLFLRPERHEYKFVVEGQELIDPGNPVFVSNNIGGWNSVLDLSEHKPAPAGEFIKLAAGRRRLEFEFRPPADGARPALVRVFFNNSLLTDQEVDTHPQGGLTVSLAGRQDGLLRLTGLDARGRCLPENHTILKGGQVLNPGSHPEDWHFTVLYSLLVDRFRDGDSSNTRRVTAADLHPLANFHGGDIAGITAALKSGYFRDLGVNAIWISPVVRQPDSAYVEWIPPNRKFTGYHGYWPILPRAVDPRFGTEAELQALVALAHRQGIRVLLDFVSNHVHAEHPYFHEHRDWFGEMVLPDGRINIRNWSEETRLTTWFDEFIPSFDYVNSPPALEQSVEDALWWVRTFDFDGFRQDAVKHVPHAFWRRLTSRLRSEFPGRDFYQIGESFGSDELIRGYVNPGELDAQFNFSIYFNAREPFSADRADFGRLRDVIRENRDAFGPVHRMGNITSSHDQVRFMALADRQLSFHDNGTERAFTDPPGPVRDSTSYAKLVNFTAFNMALPGIPVVYYGEEIGLMGAGDPDNRRPLRFDRDLEPAEQTTRRRIAVLCSLRRKYAALALGDFITLTCEGPVFIFAKIYFSEVVIVGINHGPDPYRGVVALPRSGSYLRDMIAGTRVPVDKDTATLDLPPYNQVFLELQ